MALTNWPPASGTYPEWPPIELGPAGHRVECSGWEALLALLQENNFTHAAPTGQEKSAFFNSARCGDGHTVTGRMLVSPDATRRYPFAVCNNAEREFLVLWPPYSCGYQSGPVSF